MLNIPFLSRRKSKHWQEFVHRLQSEERLMFETRSFMSLGPGVTCAVSYTHYNLAPGKVDLRIQIRDKDETKDLRLVFIRDDAGGWTLRINGLEAVPVATARHIQQAIEASSDVTWHFMMNWTLLTTILGIEQEYDRLYRVHEECLRARERSRKDSTAHEKEKRIDAGVIIRRKERHTDRHQEFWLYLPEYRLFSSREYTTANGLVYQSEYIDIEEYPTFRPPILKQLSDHLPNDAAALADSSA